MNTLYTVYRAKRIIALGREKQARGLQSLEAPFEVLEDAVIISRGGVIEAVEPYVAYRRRSLRQVDFTDFGEACLAPGLINAHCHLELSYLAGETLSGHGFAAWMGSLLEALRAPLPDADKQGITKVLLDACSVALRAMSGFGIAHVGDVGSRFTALTHQAALALAREQGRPYPLTHFLEVLGFTGSETEGKLPPTLAAHGYAPLCAADLPESCYEHCAISGHALYSTRPEGLRAALEWCVAHQRPFSLHLAESEEEEECLRRGQGALYDFLARTILPEDWTAPGCGAVARARQLGLLGPRTLAIHCVQCSADDIALLAGSGSRVCLCPSSNEYIGVGLAPGRAMAEAGIPLCLGTDGLSSNHDLDLRRDMAALCEQQGLSPRAALRLATVNGAEILGLQHLGTLEPGKAACFSLWKDPWWMVD